MVAEVSQTRISRGVLLVSSCLVVFSAFHVSLSQMSNVHILLPCIDTAIQLFNVFVVFLCAVSFILQLQDFPLLSALLGSVKGLRGQPEL